MKINPDTYYRVTCIGDRSDGDYTTRTEELLGRDIETYVMPVVNALQKYQDERKARGARDSRRNWDTFDYNEEPDDYAYKLHGFTRDEFCWFVEYFAVTGVHSIVEISVMELPKEECLFSSY